MKEIALTQGQVALVDDEDYERVSSFKWSAKKFSGKWYAYRWGGKNKNGNGATLFMHRFIIEAASGEKVDHKDGDGLNNTRKNLRIATSSQNRQNSSMSSKNKTGYKGVCFATKHQKYQAGIKVDGRSIHLGLFDDPMKAAVAYDEAAVKYHGEFARLNFPEDLA